MEQIPASRQSPPSRRLWVALIAIVGVAVLSLAYLLGNEVGFLPELNADSEKPAVDAETAISRAGEKALVDAEKAEAEQAQAQIEEAQKAASDGH